MRVCVIGSGVMGSGIAAQIANSEHDVLLLDLAKYISLDRVKNAKPAALATPDHINYINIGSIEQDLSALQDCDIVIEAIVEDLEAKLDLYKKIEPYLNSRCIIASNTSTIPLKLLKNGSTRDVIITHFFNPVRYMQLVEFVCSDNFEHKSIVRHFLQNTMGKTIVECNDTPGFIANRVGCFFLDLGFSGVENLSIANIDYLLHNLFGIPKTGLFGLWDLIGIDTMDLITSSMLKMLAQDDSYHSIKQPKNAKEYLLNNAFLGKKAKRGFYDYTQKDVLVLDLQDLTYKAVDKDKFEMYQTIDELRNSDSPLASYIKTLITKTAEYAKSIVPAVTPNYHDVDLAMKLGYGWRFGPCELYDIVNNAQKKTTNHQNLSYIKAELVNDAAQVYQLHNMNVFEIKTKMGILTKDVFELLNKTLDSANRRLYICNQSGYFSAGGDISYMLECIKRGDFGSLQSYIKLGQNTMQRILRSNVFVGANGFAVGGGCEMIMHASCVVGNIDLRAGLVEVGIGVIPAWGGLTYAIARSNGDVGKMQKAIQNIMSQKKSSSLRELCGMYELEHCQLNMNISNAMVQASQIDVDNVTLNHRDDLITVCKINVDSMLHSEVDQHTRVIAKVLQHKVFSEQRLLSAQELLDMEIGIFMELASHSAVLDKMGKVIKKT